MLMRKPGPVKAHSFLRLNVPCGRERGEEALSVGAVKLALPPCPRCTPRGLSAQGPGPLGPVPGAAPSRG